MRVDGAEQRMETREGDQHPGCSMAPLHQPAQTEQEVNKKEEKTDKKESNSERKHDSRTQVAHS
jgi:hypothetical protein